MTIPATEDLRRWLDAGAALSGNDFHYAGIELLDFVGLLDRRAVRALIDDETVIGRDDQPVRGAWVDWAGLAHTLDDLTAIGPLSGGEERLLRLAVSIAHGASVDLRAGLSGLGAEHARAVMAAVARATGIAGDIEITDTPAYRERRRADDAALGKILGDRGGDQR